MTPNLENYIELKTAKSTDPRSPPGRPQTLVKWYLQSYLLGVPTLAIGYRNYREQVFSIRRKSTREVLQDARGSVPGFDPAISLGRVYAILSELLEYFRSLGQSVCARDTFELRVDRNRDVWVASTVNSSDFAG